MHIKTIILDGFKSYQKPTEIKGFSPQFNAITGYNGSGKSNVLDSICFILGINKLDNIRAKSMSELISHGGTKATVVIKFDNTDKSLSPFGMEHLNEICVQRTITAQSTGKGCATSYTLNGHASTNSKIQDFFRGIGLNVNNPHFLIMQGRITTVLNMKPEEILGMVEEAAGTKMYDQKKKDAEKTMFVKEVKLNEIDRIYEESITPRMNKFREDRKNMVEVTRLTKVKEIAQRKLEAYQYYQALENVKRDEEAAEEVKKHLEEFDQKIFELNEELVKKETEKKELERLRDNPVEEGALSGEYREKQQISLRLEGERASAKEAIKKLTKDIERIGKNIEQEKEHMMQKRASLETYKTANSDDIEAHKKDEELIEKLRNELESITRGTVANEKGEHVSLESMIQDTRSQASALETNVKMAESRQKRATTKRENLKRELEKRSGNNATEQRAVDNAAKETEDLSARIQSLGFDSDEDNRMRDRKQVVEEKIKELENLNSRLLSKTLGGRYSMSFTAPPVLSFEAKTDVLGLLVHLVKIKPGCEEFGIAIDIALNNSYTNVVVKDQDTARILIDSKAFSGRRTMIPVSENHRNANKNAFISDSAMARAQKVASTFNEKVFKLIDMVEFPDYINNTLIGIMGQILVVETLDCANKVAYADGVKTRVLTLRGDDVRPTGCMTGGVTEHGNTSILASIAAIHPRKEEINALSKELDVIVSRIKATEAIAKQHRDMTASLQILQRNLAQLRNQVNASPEGMLRQDLAEAEEEIKTALAEIDTASKDLKKFTDKIISLEARKNNDKATQEKRKKELTSELQKYESKASKIKDRADKARREVLNLQAAVDNIGETIRKYETDWEEKKKELDELEEKLPALVVEAEAAAAETLSSSNALAEFKNHQRTLSNRLGKVSKECDLMRKEESKTRSKREEREKEVVRLYESGKANKKHSEALLRKCEWLADEQVHFNKKGGIYDFEGYSLNRGTAELKETIDKIDTIERTLCMKNVSNLDTCEAKVMDISNKRDKLKEDFDMLKKTIAVLDRKKVDELVRAHKSVNEDFGKIFTCLLPDASAQLVPPEGKTVCEGLEVKVSFNGVMKDSLHELSGGQRSLVALSLILAMLKFKPAPLYILDEVDAALDLSHTANIGMMIKTHFNKNQFVIVSLKQGMFSNADALFQTHFADGHSSCNLLVGEALLKAKNDTKLAKQAQEMIDAEKAAKKEAAKKPAKKSKPVPEEENDDL